MKPSCALTATALFAFVASSNSFVTTPTSFVARKNLSRQCMLPDVSSLVTAVEVFDGSSIVSPEVISTVFWTSLKGKIIAVVLGQVLAAVAFALLSSLLASQISQLGSFATKTFFGGSPEANDKKATTKTFIKAGQAEKQVTPDFGKLCICLAIDIIGSSSEIVPLLGDLTDVIYAPIAATALRSLYGSNVIFALEFTEEILPFTDILPLATICWVVDTYFFESDLARILQLGSFGSTSKSNDGVVEVDAYTIRDLPKIEGKREDNSFR